MSIPRLSLPHFEVKLPSDPNIIYKHRPFVIKEEKLLLMANYSDNKSDYASAIRRVIVDCALNPLFTEEYVNNLSYFDTEYLYLALRARSVGEVQEVEYTCNNVVPVENHADAKPCGHKVIVPIDFTKMEVDVPEGHSRTINLNGEVSLVLKYPTFEYIEEYDKKGQDKTVDELIDISIDYLAGLFDKIITQEGVLTTKDFTRQEAIEWLTELTEDNFNLIKQSYLDRVPKVVIKSHFKCTKCGWEQPIVLEGLESFFV